MEKEPDLSIKELNKLRGELVVIIPIFLLSLGFFLGSFQYKEGARDVPMFVGFITVILTGMRLFHIVFPKSKIGEFKEAGLAGEFDSKVDNIKAEVLKGYDEGSELEATRGEEWKAFLCLIGCFVAFLLFGYIVGGFIAMAGSYYYYGLRKSGPLLITMASMFIVIYLLLYKMLDAPSGFGLLLEPILISLGII